MNLNYINDIINTKNILLYSTIYNRHVRSMYSLKAEPNSTVDNDACCQSRGCEFEPQLGQLYVRHFNVTSVTHLRATCSQSMWKSSLLFGKYVVWRTDV